MKDYTAIITEPERITYTEAYIREQRGDPEAYYQTVEIRECMACLHNFEPETPAETACPWCGGPSMAEPPQIILHEIEPLAVEEGIGQTPEDGMICPTCDGRGGNDHWDPQWQVDCPTCEGVGKMQAGTAEQSGEPFCYCANCGADVEPADGDLVGISDPDGGDGALTCTACLADPEALHAVLGVVRFGINRRHTVNPDPV